MDIAKKADEQARAEAIHEIEALLIRNHVDPTLAAAQAQDFWREMTHAGWRHVRPQVDPTPPRAEPGDPDYREKAAAWAREQLREQLAAKREVSQ